MNEFDSLSDEILFSIFEFLDWRSLIGVSRVCKHWRQSAFLCRKPWESLFVNFNNFRQPIFALQFLAPKPMISWWKGIELPKKLKISKEFGNFNLQKIEQLSLTNEQFVSLFPNFLGNSLRKVRRLRITTAIGNKVIKFIESFHKNTSLKHLEIPHLDDNLMILFDSIVGVYHNLHLERLFLGDIPVFDTTLPEKVHIYCDICKTIMFENITHFMMGPPSQLHISNEVFTNQPWIPDNVSISKAFEDKNKISCKNQCHKKLWLIDTGSGIVERHKFKSAIALGENLSMIADAELAQLKKLKSS